MGSFIDLLQVILGNVWLYGASFLGILTILVFIHEWGHFIVARMCGVRVEVFSIGFGKEIWGRTAKNGTRWKFSIVPLGGYVKMFGDADPASAGHEDSDKLTDADRKVSFFAQPVWKRAAIVFAGPAINFIFAIILFAGLFASRGTAISPPVITAVQIEQAADKSGFKPHDRVVEINGRSADRFDDIRRAVSIALDSEMEFIVERDGELVTLYTVPSRIPMEDKFGFKHEIGRIGVLGSSSGISIKSISSVNGVKTNVEKIIDDEDNVGDYSQVRSMISKNIGKAFEITLIGLSEDGQRGFLVNPGIDKNEGLNNSDSDLFNVLILNEGAAIEYVEFGVIEAIVEASVQTWRITVDSLSAIGQIFSGQRSTKELGGVIRIGAMAGDMAERGWIAIITFMALISINLGLINLFPIPLLDGGHLAMYAVEAAKGSPVSEKSQEYAFRAGLFFLVTLMVFANLNDLLQILL